MIVFGLLLQNCALQYSALLEKVETPRCVFVMYAFPINVIFMFSSEDTPHFLKHL